MEPLVSVVMPTYNQEEFIKEAIDSVLNQTHSNWELIIVDDESTDNTVNIIREFMTKDHRIQLIRVRHHGTGDDIRLIPTKFCRGEYVTFLDSDDFLFPTSIATRLNYLEQHPELIGVAAGFSRGAHILRVDNCKFSTEAFFENFTIRANWNYLFRQDIFKNIEFKKFGLYGDAIVIYELSKLYPHQVHFLPDILYFYRFNPQSTIYCPANIQNRTHASIKTFQYFQNDSVIYSQHKEKILAYFLMSIRWLIRTTKLTGQAEKLPQVLKGYINSSFGKKTYCIRKTIWPEVIELTKTQTKLASKYRKKKGYELIPSSVRKGERSPLIKFDEITTQA